MKIPGRARCNCFLVKYIHNAKTGKTIVMSIQLVNFRSFFYLQPVQCTALKSPMQ